MPLSVAYDDIRQAAQRLAGVAHRTPVLTSATADRLTGASIFFKCENFQRVGAFKFRGAYNAVALLTAEQRHAGVVTFSSGNHGQAIALAARLQGVKATIVLPHDTPALKVAATEGYGGEVILYDRQSEDREAIGRRLAGERGLTLIPPFDHPHIIAGQGTAAKELFEAVDALDYLLVPLSGGGLISGCAIAARALVPGCQVIGVEPDTANDAQQSLRLGRIVTIPVPDTIADGARTVQVGLHNFPIMRECVHDIVTVSDRDLIDTMRFFAERMKMVVEPTGALGAAAALQKKVVVKGKRVGVLISGGNVDVTAFCKLLGC